MFFDLWQNIKLYIKGLLGIPRFAYMDAYYCSADFDKKDFQKEEIVEGNYTWGIYESLEETISRSAICHFVPRIYKIELLGKVKKEGPHIFCNKFRIIEKIEPKDYSNYNLSNIEFDCLGRISKCTLFMDRDPRSVSFDYNNKLVFNTHPYSRQLEWEKNLYDENGQMIYHSDNVRKYAYDRDNNESYIKIADKWYDENIS